MLIKWLCFLCLLFYSSISFWNKKKQQHWNENREKKMNKQKWWYAMFCDLHPRNSYNGWKTVLVNDISSFRYSKHSQTRTRNMFSTMVIPSCWFIPMLAKTFYGNNAYNYCQFCFLKKGLGLMSMNWIRAENMCWPEF